MKLELTTLKQDMPRNMPARALAAIMRQENFGRALMTEVAILFATAFVGIGLDPGFSVIMMMSTLYVAAIAGMIVTIGANTVFQGRAREFCRSLALEGSELQNGLGSSGALFCDTFVPWRGYENLSDIVKPDINSDELCGLLNLVFQGDNPSPTDLSKYVVGDKILQLQQWVVRAREATVNSIPEYDRMFERTGSTIDPKTAQLAITSIVLNGFFEGVFPSLDKRGLVTAFNQVASEFTSSFAVGEQYEAAMIAGKAKEFVESSSQGQSDSVDAVDNSARRCDEVAISMREGGGPLVTGVAKEKMA